MPLAVLPIWTGWAVEIRPLPLAAVSDLLRPTMLRSDPAVVTESPLSCALQMEDLRLRRAPPLSARRKAARRSTPSSAASPPASPSIPSSFTPEASPSAKKTSPSSRLRRAISFCPSSPSRSSSSRKDTSHCLSDALRLSTMADSAAWDDATSSSPCVCRLRNLLLAPSIIPISTPPLRSSSRIFRSTRRPFTKPSSLPPS